MQGGHAFRSNAPIRTDDIYLWTEPFVVLAIRRCQAFLLEAGVPSSMAAEPEGLLRIARRYLRAAAGEVREPLAEEETDITSEVESCIATLAPTYGHEAARALCEEQVRGGHYAVALLRLAFDRIAGLYGGQQADGLEQWMRRYFVDISEAASWREWGEIMSLTADAYRHGVLTPALPLEHKVAERLIRAVEAHFSREVWDLLNQRVARGATVTLSRLERRLLAAGRTRGPRIPAKPPDLRSVTLAAWMHRAYRLWEELDTWLSADQRDGILHWARTFRPRLELPDRYSP